MKLPNLKRSLFAIIALSALATPVVHAQTRQGNTNVPVPGMPMGDTPVCAGVDKVIPAPWTKWAAPEPLKGGSGLSTAGKLAAGHIYSAALPSSSGMSYVVPLPKPAADNTFGGLFTLTIDKAGTYSIALSEGAWIDVAPAAGPVLSSTAHGHGPACTTIHKVVDFALQPGAYVVQISGSAKSPIVIGIQPKP